MSKHEDVVINDASPAGLLLEFKSAAKIRQEQIAQQHGVGGADSKVKQAEMKQLIRDAVGTWLTVIELKFWRRTVDSTSLQSLGVSMVDVSHEHSCTPRVRVADLSRLYSLQPFM